MTFRSTRHRWAPLADAPAGGGEWGSGQYEALAERWAAARRELTDRRIERSALDIFCRNDYASSPSRPGLTPDGQRVEVEFREKGMYKTQPNNPRRPDGMIHEYCPPEQCRSEMDRLFALDQDIRGRQLPVAVEAAWLHHRFACIHPFRDGNDRVHHPNGGVTRNGRYYPPESTHAVND